MQTEAAEQYILQVTRADAILRRETLQSLWSGYGKIERVALGGADAPMSVILKTISLPDASRGTKAQAADRSHRRKVRSYDVELNWYRNWSQRCPDSARVPGCYGSMVKGNDRLIVLEDLDAAGFPKRKSRLVKSEVQTCLCWLAHFHATFLGVAPDGLWKTGTYWHLATRPDELAAMPEGPLKRAAAALDERLDRCRYKTIVHGDAKVENFCFSHNGRRVAAVDFQYVGGGCGIKDVAYLMDSAMSERDCASWEGELLEYYFGELKNGLESRESNVDFADLQEEWNALYPVAWADFYRFLTGWSPQYARLSHHCERLVERAMGVIAS